MKKKDFLQKMCQKIVYILISIKITYVLITPDNNLVSGRYIGSDLEFYVTPDFVF